MLMTHYLYVTHAIFIYLQIKDKQQNQYGVKDGRVLSWRFCVSRKSVPKNKHNVLYMN
jgi:hypothetical protein